MPAAALRRLNVIHEDRDLVVVDKPPGLLSSGLPGEDRDNLFDLVKAHVRGPKNRPARVWIIHRLDKEASGLLVFAKTEKAFEWLKEDFRAKRVHRLYVAVVEGEIRQEGTEARRHGGGEKAGEGKSEEGSEPPPVARVTPRQLAAGTIQSFIREGEESESATSIALGDVAKDSARFTSRPWRGDRPPPGRGQRERAGGDAAGPRDPGAPKLAVTHWRVLAAGRGRSLLQLRLETGRKNQIRVHMQEFKHPIAGDYRYGSQSDPLQRLALHASELGVRHPSTGQTVRFHSPAPAGFYTLIGAEAPANAVAGAGEGAGILEAAGGTSAGPAAPRQADLEAASPVVEPPADDTSWDHVAAWYDSLIEGERSDLFQQVIVPGTLRLLPRPTIGPEGRPTQATGPEGRPTRILDLACGQGALARHLAGLRLEVVGVDASLRLIEVARRRTAEAGAAARFEVGDARELEKLRDSLGPEPFDAVTCVMALMNIDPLEPVLRGSAALLRPGGAFVGVILHPAFRSPGQTRWGWERQQEEDARGFDGPRGRPPRRDGPPPRGKHGPGRSSARPGAKPPRQYRRVDGYLSPGQFPITMNPGKAAHGAAPVTTWTYHRPIQAYVKGLAEAGFAIEALEEWPSMRQSQPGPRAAEENRARREIPMFLGFRAVRR
ncbi:MAG: pseudouridine synthase [Phycisphaerales bacterium]